MSFETIRIDIDRRVATITINRPEQRNALNGAVRTEIIAALEDLGGQKEVRVVVFTGAGEKAFIAGADVAEFANRTVEEQREVMEAPRVFDTVADFPKPTIAMVNGYALGGGCELALACDLRVAGYSARFGQPEVKLGLLPGGGGTQRLPRLVGLGRAVRIMLTGELIDAEEAERIGLADYLVDDDALSKFTMELARGMAEHSPVALRLIKQAVRAAMEQPLTRGLNQEREYFLAAFASEDGREGVGAFLEKRQPEFAGR